jgi:hypothetical protein
MPAVARKPKLKQGTVDLVAESRERAEKSAIRHAKKQAKLKEDARKAGLKEPADRVPFAQYKNTRAREANQKIRFEKKNKIRPLVIEFLGGRIPVVDPNGTWAMRSPPYLESAYDLVAHVIAKQDPSIKAVLDLETWQLFAGVLHHAASLRFEDDDKQMGEEDRPKVQFHKTWEDVKNFLLGLMRDLINDCMRDPETSPEGKVWAHNGSNFDWVGFALSLGMDRVTGYWCEILANDENGEEKIYKVNFRISTFSGKSRITLSTGSGPGGQYRLQLLDSYHIITAPLSVLGDKGVTPLQFTDPLAWINGKKCSITGENFNLTTEDVRPYRFNAHKPGRTLESFRDSGEITDITYEGLSLWLNTLDSPEYTCDDVIILANAMKSYAAKFRFFAKPLADLLGQEAVDSLRPFSFNTASSGGFALAVAYWYESRLQRDENGIIGLKDSLKKQYKERYFALIAGRDFVQVMSEAEAMAYVRDQLKAEKTVRIQRHGIVNKGETVLIEYPVCTTQFDNRFSRMAQNGSQTTVFKTMAHQMLEVDANSAFPAAMARGCERRVVRQGFEHKGMVIGRYESPEKINALVGYEEPSNRVARPTKDMITHGIATCEEIMDEHGELRKMWVVRGRQKILAMLNFRSGEFSVVLPPSLDPELNMVPGTPIRTPGRALDSRLVNPRIAQPSLLFLRGEYIASYACSPTVDDNAMVIFLGEDFVDEDGKKQFRNRSRHGQIMGITVEKDGSISGQPHNPLKKFIEIAYNKRLEEKNMAKKALAAGDLKLYERMTYEATMTKLILNGGSYGTFAQNKQPERDFSLEDLGECLEIIESLAGLDPHWEGMRGCIKRLTPGYEFEDAGCSWSDLYNSIEQFNVVRVDAQANLEKWSDLYRSIGEINADKIAAKANLDKWTATAASVMRIQVEAFRLLFSTWAVHQITTFSSYRYKSPELDEDGHRIFKARGIITSAEETASHAIRCFASAVVAKAAVNLHLGQLAIQRSPFGLAYSDTDSLHAETGIIKPFDNVRAVAYVNHTYEVVYGDQPDDHVAGLQRLMNDPSVRRAKIFTDILEIYGLRTGELLGQWGLESHKYTKGLVSPVADGKPYSSHRTFYLGPKVYIDTDSNHNAARTKVRSIPKLNPVHPAVLEGVLVSIPSLADRRGLDQENFRAVTLDGTREVKFGGKRRRVETLFSSPRRKYQDSSNSTPFDLELSPEMNSRILRGDLISPEAVARDAMSTIGLDEEMTNIKGLQDAYMIYKSQVRIQGMSFDTVKQQVQDDILYKQGLINYQKLRETENPIEESTQMIKTEDDFLDWISGKLTDIEVEMKKEA